MAWAETWAAGGVVVGRALELQETWCVGEVGSRKEKTYQRHAREKAMQCGALGRVYELHAWEETYKGFVGVLAKTKMGRGDLGELDLGLDIKWAQ